MAVALSLSSAPVGGYAWRMRAAIVVDLAVGLATLPILGFLMAQLNTLLGVVFPQAGPLS